MYYYSLLNFCLLLVLSSNAIASEPLYIKPNYIQKDTLNQFDAQGKKHGYWIFYGVDVDSSLHYFPNDGKLREGTFIHGRKDGLWIFYFNDGSTPKLKGHFSNNRPDGKFIKFWPNGKIKEEGEFAFQKYSNELKRFNEAGILIYKASFDDRGDESGEVSYFYDDGTPQFVYNAEKGKPIGEATRYYPNGDIKERIVYDETGSLVESTQLERVNPEKNAVVKSTEKKAPSVKDKSTLKLNGYNKVYNENHELWQDGEFKDGLLWDGKVYIYDEDGLLLKIEVFKEGRYHSDGQL